MVTIRKPDDLTSSRGMDLFPPSEATQLPESITIKIDKFEPHLHFYNTTGDTEQSDIRHYSSSRGSSASKFVKEAIIGKELKNVVLEMQNGLDDEEYLGQLKIAFLSTFSKIEERKERREAYFSDLCVMVIESVRNANTKTLTKANLEVLMNAINDLSKKLSQDRIGELRKIFRKAKLNFLPKLTPVEPHSVEEKLKAFFS